MTDFETECERVEAWILVKQDESIQARLVGDFKKLAELQELICQAHKTLANMRVEKGLE